MNEPNLAQLWQAQTVVSIDSQAIQRDYRRQKVKQWCYAGLDVLGLAPFVYVFGFAQSGFSPLALGLMAGMALLAAGSLIYLLWLRRLAMFGRSTQTTQYARLLGQQFANNVTIAGVTKILCAAVPLSLTGFFAVLFWQGELSAGQWQKYCQTLPVLLAVMAGLGVWAHRRQQHFRAEQRRLQTLLGDSD